MSVRKLFAISILVISSFEIAYPQSGWERLDSTTDQNLFSVYFLDDSTGWVGGDNKIILKTIDSGQNWTLQTITPLVSVYGVSFADNNYGTCIGSSGAVMKTTNGGDNWSTIQEGWLIDLHGVFQMDSLWACAVGQGSILQPLVIVTTDGWQNLSWNIFYIVHNGNHEGFLTDVHFFDHNTGCAVGGAWNGTGVIVRTTDGGANWDTRYWGGATLRGIDFPTPDTGYAVGLQGDGLKTTDGGITWTELYTGVAVELLDVSFGTADAGTAVGAFGFIVRTVDGGQSWYTQNFESNAHLRGVFFVNADIGYAVGDSGIVLYTSTGGDPPSQCDYVVGDANDNGTANGIDVTYLVAYLKGGPEPPVLCPCGSHGDMHVAADVNGSCSVNGLDVTYFVAYFKGGPDIYPCPDCPPAP